MSYFLLLLFFSLEEGRGHEFWVHLKMFITIFDLLAHILKNGTVKNGEMRSQVALMPVIIKFSPNN